MSANVCGSASGVAGSETTPADVLLAPCPFCGGAMEQHPRYPNEWRHEYRRRISCPAGMTVIYANQPPAISAWNRRAADPVRGELVEALTDTTNVLEKVAGMLARGIPPAAGLVLTLVGDVERARAALTKAGA